MLERVLSSEIDKAYADLKATLLSKDCKIISEEAPNQILVKQGSLWGISPTNAKKTIKANLAEVDSKTKITLTSKISSDWNNITVIGCILSAVLVGLCLWITFDLTGFMASHHPSFWSWLITVNGIADDQVGAAFVGLTKSLALFLSIIIAVEVAILFYAKAKIDSFAQDVLKTFAGKL